jgi:type I restriction enzyme S subunit
MSRLDALIAELCPDGVEYVELEKVIEITDGYPFKSNEIKEIGEFPLIKISEINNGEIHKGNFFIAELPENIKNKQILSGKEVLVAMSGSTGKTGINRFSKILVNQRIAILRNHE